MFGSCHDRCHVVVLLESSFRVVSQVRKEICFFPDSGKNWKAHMNLILSRVTSQSTTVWPEVHTVHMPARFWDLPVLWALARCKLCPNLPYVHLASTHQRDGIWSRLLFCVRFLLVFERSRTFEKESVTPKSTMYCTVQVPHLIM